MRPTTNNWYQFVGPQKSQPEGRLWSPRQVDTAVLITVELGDERCSEDLPPDGLEALDLGVVWAELSVDLQRGKHCLPHIGTPDVDLADCHSARSNSLASVFMNTWTATTASVLPLR